VSHHCNSRSDISNVKGGYSEIADLILEDKTMSVDGLGCIFYARIYIPYMRTILYHYIRTGRPPVPISSSELKLKTTS